MSTTSEPTYVLDTDTITLWQRGNPSILARVTGTRPSHRFITIITEIEQLQGRYQQIVTASTPEQLQLAQQRLDWTREWLARMQVVPIDRIAAETFGSLLSMKLGKLRRKDLLIASIVLGHNYVLVTRNLKDFQRVPGLKVEDWSS